MGQGEVDRSAALPPCCAGSGPEGEPFGELVEVSEQGSEQPVQPVQPVQAEFQVTFNINSTLILTP